MSQDLHLQNAVLAELRWEPSLDAAHIGVAANAGVVTLTGHVSNYAEKEAAENAAGRVKGVKAVAEEIEVRLPSHSQRGDDEIAASAIHRINWDVAIPKDAIKIVVEKGWITLTGEVTAYYQKVSAEQQLRRLMGVTGVTNHITIKPKVDVGNLNDEITHALGRSWFFDPNTISVSADGGKVRLTGTVETPHERKLAAVTAWAAPGVTDVVNEIVVL